MNAKGMDKAAFNEIRLHAVHKHVALTAKQVKRIARDALSEGVISSLAELAEDQLFADLVYHMVHVQEDAYGEVMELLKCHVPSESLLECERLLTAYWSAYSRAMFVCGLLMGNPAGMVM
jgi:hypothetical protein